MRIKTFIKFSTASVPKFISYNVHEYAKPRRCFQNEFQASDKRILALQTLNFKKRGLGEGDMTIH